jgi:hypothetical protein
MSLELLLQSLTVVQIQGFCVLKPHIRPGLCGDELQCFLAFSLCVDNQVFSLINFSEIRSCIQVEVTQLRRELADKETQLSARTPEKEKLADDELSWLDVLSHDINENVQERINLQKALFELEDMNLHNRAELQQLDDLIMNLVITSHVSQYLYLSSYLGQ